MARKLTDTIRYSKPLAKRICREIASGKTLPQLVRESTESKKYWCPSYNTLLLWKRKHPEYKIMLDQAYIDRADLYMENLFDVMDQVKTGVLSPPQGKVLIDGYHKLLEKVHPLYAPKKAVQVDAGSGGVQFNIVMDSRPPALPVPSVEGEEIEDEEEGEEEG